jgi:hypothetical protein
LNPAPRNLGLVARLAGVVATLAVAACGSSSSSSPQTAPALVAVSGIVTFDRVPIVPGQGLDYARAFRSPARGVTVELTRGGAVVASITTDAEGRYRFDVAANTQVALRVRAEMLRVGTPSWDFRVLDNVNGGALYVLDGATFDTGTADTVRDLNAASGWTGSAYTAPRAAAPFAILDVVYDGAQLVLTAAPNAAFPALALYWSPANRPVQGSGLGEIGGSFFRPDAGIFLVGAVDQDTDEYDRHVIAHEWGHYLEHHFSRSDSIGGRHTLTDHLDMRLAFAEAWANAFSAMVTKEAVYVDAFGPAQRRTFSFDLEQSPSRRNPNPGWFNEESVQSLLFDLYDTGRDLPPESGVLDDLALGFAPLFAALMGPQRSTGALTTVFPLIHSLKQSGPADVPLIDALTVSQRIAAVVDDYGSSETNFGVPTTQRDPQDVRADFASVYSALTVGGAAVNVCSLDDFASATTGAANKLASRRFVRFTVDAPGLHVITAHAVAPLNAAADPDMELFRAGSRVASSNEAPQCTAATPETCIESFAQDLAAGDYVLEVFEWTNTNDFEDQYPPIGRTCFDVTVTR